MVALVLCWPFRSMPPHTPPKRLKSALPRPFESVEVTVGGTCALLAVRARAVSETASGVTSCHLNRMSLGEVGEKRLRMRLSSSLCKRVTADGSGAVLFARARTVRETA